MLAPSPIKLPEGEQLYTGVKRVTYHLPTTSNNSNGKSQAASDSAGVITSIANAVEAIDRAVNGLGFLRLSL